MVIYGQLYRLLLDPARQRRHVDKRGDAEENPVENPHDWIRHQPLLGECIDVFPDEVEVEQGIDPKGDDAEEYKQYSRPFYSFVLHIVPSSLILKQGTALDNEKTALNAASLTSWWVLQGSNL